MGESGKLYVQIKPVLAHYLYIPVFIYMCVQGPALITLPSYLG